MAGPVVDGQSDAVRTTPRRIAVGLLAIASVTWLVVREGDLAAYPGGNLVLACGIFIVLSRVLPH
ncbi:hypothetical protein [Mesorhizobium sp. INR15]|uniref:hypothetical protein n=1 Tax=Mesorhizobium sp. INR15 TaxID=2654248 RepID=UPI0018967BB1|nr:hypothetical protein [Mesorhizobium sp. INR15]